MATSARDACTAASTSICSRKAGSKSTAISSRNGAYRRQIRRFDLRRTRRRSIRGELLPIMFGEDLVQAFWEFKTAFDPENKMNPGKVVLPSKIDENLRWGVDYEPKDPRRTSSSRGPRQLRLRGQSLRWGRRLPKARHRNDVPELHGDQRGTYSTRGRARLLFEMLKGARSVKDGRTRRFGRARPLPIVQGLQARVPRERRHGHLQSRVLVSLLPRAAPAAAYVAFGFMFWWAKLASLAPGVVKRFHASPAFGL